jgi:hypothetical protein
VTVGYTGDLKGVGTRLTYGKFEVQRFGGHQSHSYNEAQVAATWIRIEMRDERLPSQND